MMAIVAVTGASGFVGQRIWQDLARRGHVVFGVFRSPLASSAPMTRVVGDIGAQTDWARALERVEVVVHCAARTHVIREQSSGSLQLYCAVNVDGTRRLAEHAARFGVRRLVYLSSVKAAGERSVLGRPLTSSDLPVPEDAYGASKLEAERALFEVGAATGLETVIVRPPLVYGPGVKGNFLRLMCAIDRGWPLPLGALENRRSLVSLANLADFVGVCVGAPAAAGRTFFVSDDEDVSTADLAHRIAAALGKRARMFRVPSAVLSRLAGMAGKSAEIDRLVGTLQVDMTEARALLAWLPPYTVEQGLRETALWFKGLR